MPIAAAGGDQAMYETGDEAIRVRLAEFDELSTLSSFTRHYYYWLAVQLEEFPSAEGLRLAFAGLLDIELRYHRLLEQLVEKGESWLVQLKSAQSERRVGLECVVEFTSWLGDLAGLAAGLREAVLAECHFQLHQTAECVAALERALQAGLPGPVPRFALGYNLYMLGLERFSRPDSQSGEFAIADHHSFQLSCLRAVAELEKALGEERWNGYFYWWMGQILESAGLTDAASDAYDKAALEYRIPGEMDEEDAAEGIDGEEDEVSMENSTSARAISESEVRRAVEWLKGKFTVADIIKDKPEEGS